MRTPPVAGPHDLGARRRVQIVHRGFLAWRSTGARQGAQLHRCPRRSGRRALRLGERGPRGASAQPLRRHHARFPLAGAHRDRRVSLQELHRREAFGHRLLELLVGDVHAQAGELLAGSDTDLGRQDDRVLRPGGLATHGLDPRVDVGRGDTETLRCFQTREPSLCRRGLGGDRARHRADRVDVVGQRHRQERLRPFVELDLRPRHREQVGGRRGEPRQHHQIAGHGGPRPCTWCADRDAGDVAPARRRQDRGAAGDPVALARRGIGPQVGNRDRRARLDQRASGAVTSVVGGEHHRLPAGKHAEPVDEDLHGGREHHTGQVVVREDHRLFDRTGRHHDVTGADAVQGRLVGCRDHRTLEDPEGRGTGEHPCPGGLRSGAEFTRGVTAGAAEQGAARLLGLLQDQDVEAGGGGLGGCGQPGGTGTDHGYIGMQRDPFARRMVFLPRDLAQAGLRADERLHQRPGPLRVLEDLVVEARRHHERDLVQPPMDVTVRRRPRVLAFDLHPVRHRLDAGTDVGDAVDLHHAVGTGAGHAEQATGAVILERATGDRHPGGGEGRPDRVPLVRGDALAIERESDRPVAADRPPVAGGDPLAHADAPSGSSAGRSVGTYVARIAFVKVCRSARNHTRHPSRCNHHSVCHPFTFSRK